MKFIKIKCDRCGSDLEADFSQGYAFCQYCGNKLYADYSDDLLIEKEKTKQKLYELGKEIEKNKPRSNHAISNKDPLSDSEKSKPETDQYEEINNWIDSLRTALYVQLFIFCSIIAILLLYIIP